MYTIYGISPVCGCLHYKMKINNNWSRLANATVELFSSEMTLITECIHSPPERGSFLKLQRLNSYFAYKINFFFFSLIFVINHNSTKIQVGVSSSNTIYFYSDGGIYFGRLQATV